MVEVRAHILGGPVLLAGDTVHVCVTLTLPPLNPNLPAQSSDVYEIVAWSSAQIHCLCTINDSKVKLPSSEINSAEEKAVTNAATSFAPWRGEKGRLVLATKPKILFCDLQLLPGESRSFIYKENIPLEAPPTYRGHLVKYAYKVTVGTQRFGSPISLLRLPLRIIILQGLGDACQYSESEELAPSNPFLHTPQRDTTRITALQMIQNLSSRKNVNQYNITNNNGQVVCFTIYKTSFRLGEDIVATLDFTTSEVPCVQYSATLQSEEILEEKCRKFIKQKPIVISYSKTHEFCLNFSNTHLLLPIPLHVTPTFSTNLVALKWRIHFEFVLRAKKFKEQNTDADCQISWHAPAKIEVETMVWDLPVILYPTDPAQISHALGHVTQESHQL